VLLVISIIITYQDFKQKKITKRFNILIPALANNPDIPNSDQIHDLGILQMMWLAQRRPDIASVVDSVEIPTAESLRRAGMTVASRLRSRAHADVGDEKSVGEEDAAWSI
jgi:hypothetical protein